MTYYQAFAFFISSALAAGVNGYTMPLASDPTNVRNQWDLPDMFGGVTIPGAHIDDSSVYGYYQEYDDEEDLFFSPLQPVDPHSQYDLEDEHGYSGYEPFWNSRSRSRSLLPLSSSPPSPLSAGSVWRQNNNLFGKNSNSFVSNRGRGSRSFSRGTPALSMANYMQNGGPNNDRDRDRNRNSNSNYSSNNNNNREYNNYNRDNYDYDDRNRNSRGRGSYNDDTYESSRGGQPRGTNRFNTVGSVGSVNGSNVSRGGRSMQFQNRRDSNLAGRSGRMMDDSYRQFAPDSNTRFESRRPNDAYAKGGYSQDSKTGHWTDPNSNYNINESPRPTYSSDTRYSSPSYSSTSGGRVTAPDAGMPRGYDRGRYGAGGNVPYDNAYYNNNNYENQDYYDNDGDSDFYSRNGNIMDNRRGSRGGGGNSPGMDQNYYNIDGRDSNRRMDRGGGMMRYRPNNQRPDGGYYGNGYDYEVGGYDDYYDSSGSFYNSEGKRVRRFDRYSDRPDGYYNPDQLSNDFTDPDRALQNQRRRDGRDVQNGAHLRRYDPEWDSQQGLYDEASLYGSDVKGTRSYTHGYGDNMDNQVVPRRQRRASNDLGDGWGETGGRNRYGRSATLGDYQEGDYIEDGYDRGQSRFNRQGDRYRRASGRDDYDNNDSRRGLGRRDMDGERDYYRSGDYNGPNLRGDDTMERFRQGKDVRKTDLYGYETANTPSSRKRIRRSKKNRVKPADDMRQGRTVNGSYNGSGMREGRTVNGSYNRGRSRSGGGRINGSAGRDRGMSLDDLNEML